MIAAEVFGHEMVLLLSFGVFILRPIPTWIRIQEQLLTTGEMHIAHLIIALLQH